MEILVDAMGGERRTASAGDPLGRPIEAQLRAWCATASTAIVEVAAASGLRLVDEASAIPSGRAAPGTGELIAAAIGAGARRILVAAGGSATTDGGRGAIERPPGGRRAWAAPSSRSSATPPSRSSERPRCSRPQKGASPEQVERLSSRLSLRRERCRETRAAAR